MIGFPAIFYGERVHCSPSRPARSGPSYYVFTYVRKYNIYLKTNSRCPQKDHVKSTQESTKSPRKSTKIPRNTKSPPTDHDHGMAAAAMMYSSVVRLFFHSLRGNKAQAHRQHETHFHLFRLHVQPCRLQVAGGRSCF